MNSPDLDVRSEIEEILDSVFMSGYRRGKDARNKAPQDLVPAATQFIEQLLDRVRIESEMFGRKDELRKMFGRPKKGEIGYEAVKSRLAQLKATKEERGRE